MPADNTQLKRQLYSIVNSIPQGYVLTYGVLAVLLGIPQSTRLVGKLMSEAPENVNAHRVVNHAGRTVPGWNEQRSLLISEGVEFKPNGCVNLKKRLWQTL